jgi:hypothetical protein
MRTLCLLLCGLWLASAGCDSCEHNTSVKGTQGPGGSCDVAAPNYPCQDCEAYTFQCTDSRNQTYQVKVTGVARGQRASAQTYAETSSCGSAPLTCH